MLGRLRMSIDQCEEVYVALSEKIFTPRRAAGDVVGRVLDFVDAQGRFSTEALETCIKSIIKNEGFSEDELFYTRDEDTCNV